MAALHQAVLEDGNPDVYREWADQYEADSIKLGYSGHKSVVSKWCNIYNAPSNETIGKKYQIFDAGCGTGFIADQLVALIAHDTIELYGGDTSQDMISIAASKTLYKNLKVLDLNETLPYPPDTFDSILSAGVFLQGHCGPSCLPNLTAVLKPGGYIIATVRAPFYEETKQEWSREIKRCNCKLIEDDLMPYRPDVQGVVMVIRKK